MAVTASKFNMFSFFKLPAAWWCGVRLKTVNKNMAIVTVRHRWINQNPFNSMFWAVQGMAAELSTGAMIIDQIEATGKKISMLVANNKANFSKKATGKITFTCEDGYLIKEALDKSIDTGEGQTIRMKSVGVNENGVVVSTFHFEWTVRLKK
ncbi:protein of unknown function [Maribacter orientalis]|uniref:Acyl-coenzyme A thioesterase PaaI, contains HGG motif n=1 Tax=Maribacter orientalis TaxID=228957 RepID=A0A1H7GAK4_9FLAO|nr:DUF4442 domain-containing protein [Maribacter orientalis]SEK33842.1 protein of unknown function [Maribacter orientalis]